MYVIINIQYNLLQGKHLEHKCEEGFILLLLIFLNMGHIS